MEILFLSSCLARLTAVKFDASGVPQETVVNQGMKSLLFQAFVRTPLAPPPRLSNAPHPLIKFDRAANARVL
jgi:hypothetical protein